jgi:putative FmdB family regulatory protein
VSRADDVEFVAVRALQAELGLEAVRADFAVGCRCRRCEGRKPRRDAQQVQQPGSSLSQVDLPTLLKKSRSAARTTIGRAMPIYEFECGGCGARFEELVGAGTDEMNCPECGADRAQRLLSNVSPPGRQPRGARVRSDESQRRERESARQGRIADARKKRAAGETVRPSKKGGG